MKQWQNFQAFSKVKTGIEQQLRDAAATLENSLDKDEVAALSPEECSRYAASLNRIAGILRMMECQELALLAEEILGLLEDAAGCGPAIEQQNVKEMLELAFVALTDFPALLEGVLSGQVPHWNGISQLFNRIRQARGRGLMFSSQALLTRQSVTFRKVFADNPEHLRTLLDQQLKLYNNLKAQLQTSSNSMESVKELYNLFVNLEVLSRDFRLATLWGLCAAIAEAMLQEQSGPDLPSMKLLCSFSTIIQMVRDKGVKALNQNVPEEILARVLTVLGGLHVESERLCSIRCWFRLDHKLVHARQKLHQELLVSYSRKDAFTKVIKLMTDRTGQLSDQINDALGEGHNTPQQIIQFTSEMRAMQGPLAAIGMQALVDLLAVCADSSPADINIDVPLDQARSVDYLDRCAQTLYRCELSLQRHAEELERAVFVSRSGKQDKTALTGGKLSVVLEAIKNLDQVVIAINDYAEAEWESSKLHDVAKLLHGTGFALGTVPLVSAANFCAVAAKFVETRLKSGVLTAQDPSFENATHAFAHVVISAILYLEQLSIGREENCRRIEQECNTWLEILRFGDAPAVLADVPDMVGSETGSLVIDISNGISSNVTDTHVTGSVEAAMGAASVGIAGELVTEPRVRDISAVNYAIDDKAAKEDGTRNMQSVITTHQVDATDEDEDEEIHAIFVEEASELLDQINECHAALSERADDADALTTLRRSYHTLKGSGRMVGASAIGALAWRVENLLNNVISGRLQSVAPMLDMLQQMRVRLTGLVADFDMRLLSSRDADSVAHEVRVVDAFLPEEKSPVSEQAPAAIAADAKQPIAEPVVHSAIETEHSAYVDVRQAAMPATAAAYEPVNAGSREVSPGDVAINETVVPAVGLAGPADALEVEKPVESIAEQIVEQEARQEILPGFTVDTEAAERASGVELKAVRYAEAATFESTDIPEVEVSFMLPDDSVASVALISADVKTSHDVVLADDHYTSQIPAPENEAASPTAHLIEQAIDTRVETADVIHESVEIQICHEAGTDEPWIPEFAELEIPAAEIAPEPVLTVVQEVEQPGEHANLAHSAGIDLLQEVHRQDDVQPLAVTDNDGQDAQTCEALPQVQPEVRSEAGPRIDHILIEDFAQQPRQYGAVEYTVEAGCAAEHNSVASLVESAEVKQDFEIEAGEAATMVPELLDTAAGVVNAVSPDMVQVTFSIANEHEPSAVFEQLVASVAVFSEPVSEPTLEATSGETMELEMAAAAEAIADTSSEDSALEHTLAPELELSAAAPGVEQAAIEPSELKSTIELAVNEESSSHALPAQLAVAAPAIQHVDNSVDETPQLLSAPEFFHLATTFDGLAIAGGIDSLLALQSSRIFEQSCAALVEVSHEEVVAQINTPELVDRPAPVEHMDVGMQITETPVTVILDASDWNVSSTALELVANEIVALETGLRVEPVISQQAEPDFKQNTFEEIVAQEIAAPETEDVAQEISAPQAEEVERHAEHETFVEQIRQAEPLSEVSVDQRNLLTEVTNSVLTQISGQSEQSPAMQELAGMTTVFNAAEIGHGIDALLTYHPTASFAQSATTGADGSIEQVGLSEIVTLPDGSRTPELAGTADEAVQHADESSSQDDEGPQEPVFGSLTSEGTMSKPHYGAALDTAQEVVQPVVAEAVADLNDQAESANANLLVVERLRELHVESEPVAYVAVATSACDVVPVESNQFDGATFSAIELHAPGYETAVQQDPFELAAQAAQPGTDVSTEDAHAAIHSEDALDTCIAESQRILQQEPPLLEVIAWDTDDEVQLESAQQVAKPAERRETSVAQIVASDEYGGSHSAAEGLREAWYKAETETSETSAAIMELALSHAEAAPGESDVVEIAVAEVATATDSLVDILEVEFRRRISAIRQYLDGSITTDADGLPVSSTSYLIPVHTLYGNCKVVEFQQFGTVVGRLERLLQDHPYRQVSPILQALLAGFCDLTEKLIQNPGTDSRFTPSVELQHKLDAFVVALDQVRKEMSGIGSVEVSDENDIALIKPESDGNGSTLLLDDDKVAVDDESALVLEGFMREARSSNALVQNLYAAFKHDNSYETAIALRLRDQFILLEGAAVVAQQHAILPLCRELTFAYQQYADGFYTVTPVLEDLLGKCQNYVSGCLRSLESGASVEAVSEDLQSELKLSIQQLISSRNAAKIQIAEEQVEDSLLAVFIEEASEILQDLDSKIADWQQAPDDRNIFDELLRSLHTLKGSAALVGEKQMSEAAHLFESCVIDSSKTNAPRTRQFFVEVDRHLNILQVLFSLYKADGSGRLVKAPMSDDDLAQLTRTSAEQGRVEAVAAQVETMSWTESQKTQFAEPQAEVESFGIAVMHDAGGKVSATGKTGTTAAGAESGTTIDEHVRVSANLLKSLLNDADEISISRNRVEQSIADMQILMADMEETLGRIESSMNTFEFYSKTRTGIRQGENGIGKPQADADTTVGKDFDALEMDKYTELQQVVLSLLEDYNDVRDLKNNVSGKIKSIGTVLDEQQRSTNKLQEGLVSSQMVPFAGIAPRLRRLVRQVGTELDKQVTINFDNPEGKIDRSVLQALINPIEHMIRNALDHGIESEAERLAAGKVAQGELQVKLYRQGANILLDITDDGRGINTAKVRQKAIEQGLLAEGDKATEQELCQFILRAGFSTSDTVSRISGRGVGLDVVQDEISQIGGDIEILSRPGSGTTFRIRLPMASSLNRALLFSVGGADYVMLLNTIDGIILEKNETLQRCHGEEIPTFFNYGDKSYELAYLGSLLDEQAVPEFQGGISASSSLVLVSGNGKNLALHVDSVVGSRELLVKSLGAQFAGISVLTGGVILGDGRVVVVLDPRFLVENHGTRKVVRATSGRSRQNENATMEFETGKTIMVVDDSITVRKVTSAILKRNGMNVILAKNGMEAVELLQTTKPDVMLLDIEMPKMDGFEVAAYIRRQEDGIRNLPIIMITSRIGDKHRTRAEEIGVNQYMCKPFQEVNLLEAIAGYN